MHHIVHYLGTLDMLQSCPKAYGKISSAFTKFHNILFRIFPTKKKNRIGNREYSIISETGFVSFGSDWIVQQRQLEVKLNRPV